MQLDFYLFQPTPIKSVHFLCSGWMFSSFLSIFSSAQSCETPVFTSNQSPNPNNPAEYCSTIPPLQQAQASGVLSSPPPTVMVPVGVLKQAGNEGTSRNLNALSAVLNLKRASAVLKLLSLLASAEAARVVTLCVTPPSAILTREQRRVWFADGVLPNGDAAESSKPPAASLAPPQSSVSTYSNKSSTSEYTEVRLEEEDLFYHPPPPI